MSRIVSDIQKILEDARAAREKTAAQGLELPSEAPNIPQTADSATADKLLKVAEALKHTHSRVSLQDMNSFLRQLK